MSWIEANGASLRYELEGDGEDTLVLIHEAGGAIESWDYVWPAFTRRFRTLRYDQRGFGLSEKFRGVLSVEAVVADLAALLDTLGITGRSHVLGSAFGGAMAIGFAARHPERVARLVASAPGTGVSGAGRQYVEERANNVERLGMRSAVDLSLANSYPENLRGDKARWEKYRCRWLTNDPSCFAALNRMVGSMDMTPDFPRVQCPTLVMAGVHDKLRAPEVIKRVADAIPGSEFRVVDSGHFMAIQHPELLVEHALEFFAAVS
jgi:3-oxoadipate enol-lactonase